jgi:histone deacetylase 1/2
MEEAKNLVDQLAIAGKATDDQDLISFLLGGLWLVFTPFITSFNFACRDKDLSFDDFQAELLSFETLIDAQNNSAFEQHYAFAITHKKKPPFMSRKPRPPTLTPKPQLQQSSSHPNKGNHFPPTTRTNDRPTCQICDKRGHIALDCYHHFDFSYQGRLPPADLAAIAAESHSSYDQNVWYADSGANAHITAHAANLTNQTSYEGADTVQVGNGSGLVIKNTGTSTLYFDHASFTLKHILHCPNASANLLSINQLCLDNDCYFVLTATNFYVKDNKTNRILLQGLVENGLYPFAGHQSSSNKMRCFTAKLGIQTSLETWHNRLGHPAKSTLNSLRHYLPVSNSSNKLDFCHSCQLGKATKLPFVDSTRYTTKPLQLIHTDVWVSLITSIGGCRYYVIFVDDFSRFTWMYPLRFKSDVFNSFQQYKALVENLFSSKIQQLQSDNGGEYLSNDFKSFLTKHGIHHRLACPYTSQKNGLAERKHRHIQETGLTLLAKAHLPNKYWTDAFLTAVFLINRLPTKVLHNLSPYFVLHKKMSSYTSLRTFGCTCYPYLRPYKNHKLSFRSKQCLFLGYATQHKGYRCLDLDSGRIYISRHVVFDENSFPAKDNCCISPDQPSTMSTGLFPISHSIPLHLNPSSNLIDLACENNTSSSPFTTSSLPNNDSVALPLSVSPSESNIDINSYPKPTNHDPQVPSLEQPIRTILIRSKTGNSKPKDFSGFQMFYSTHHPFRCLTSILTESEPTCYT